MKKIKIIVPFILALIVFLIPFKGAFAYTDGLLNGKSIIFNGTSNTTKVTDNNLGSGVALTGGQYLEYTFSQPMYLTHIQWDVPNLDTTSTATINATGTAYLQFEFFNASGTKIFTQQPQDNVKTTINSTYANQAIAKVRVTNFSNPSTQNITKTVNEMDVWGAPNPPVTHDEISNFTADKTYNSVTLKWNIPTTNTNFTGTKIYRNGTLIKTASKTDTTFTDGSLDSEKDYTYKLTAVYSDGFETNGLTKTVTTEAAPKPPGEVTELTATPSYDKVDLSWKLPVSENFKTARIYRDTIQQTSMLEKVIFGNTAFAASTPIFETNGTTFKDLTVEQGTIYEYTVTTVSDKGLESEGVTATVTVPEEPKPVITEPNLSESDNGDYVASWTAPTTGKMRVYVGGTLYKEVAASELKVIIPKSDMKNDVLGNPSVILEAVSESGKTSEKSEIKGVGKVNTPFTVNDLIGTGSNLIWWIAPFVLLALSFLLVPKLRKLLFGTLRNGRKEGSETREKKARERRYKAEEKEAIDKQEKEIREKQIKERQEREQHQGKEYLQKISEKEERTRERKERAPKEPKTGREGRERKERERLDRHFQKMTREPREPRGSTRQPREPRRNRRA